MVLSFGINYLAYDMNQVNINFGYGFSGENISSNPQVTFQFHCGRHGKLNENQRGKPPQ